MIKRFAILDDSGIVANITKAENDFGLSQGWVQSDVAQIGWVYDPDTQTFSEHVPDITKTEALEKLFQVCNHMYELLATDYPERETATWAVQLQEALAYKADPNSPTPFISASLEEGETVDDYANLIVMNNQAWSNYAGSIVRKRRYYEKAIAAAQDSAELNALVAEFENGDHKII